MVRNSDRCAEYAARPRLRAQHHPMQRNTAYRGVSIRGGCETDENKEPDSLLDLPCKPQIQTAAAEIVKDSALFEPLSFDVETPRYCWKRGLDARRDTTLGAAV